MKNLVSWVTLALVVYVVWFLFIRDWLPLHFQGPTQFGSGTAPILGGPAGQTRAR